MAATRSYRIRYRHWRRVAFAGVVCFAVTLFAMEILAVRAVSLNSLSIGLATLAGSLLGVCVVGAISGWRIRRRLANQNLLLDAAVNNMIQGLCMFDAQNRLLVWNERYRSMYNIDPKRIWRGCGIRDLLDARIAAGTFPLDPARYGDNLRAAIKLGRTFIVTVELTDGRVIDVVNQPMKGGGWVATHEDITEHTRAERELEQTRTFLDTIIENVPSPIIVKGAQDLRYMLINRAAEQYLGVNRHTMLGKRAVEVLPKITADQIEEQDRKLIEAGTIIVRDEHTVVTPGNGTRIVTSTRLPVNDAAGKPQYLISVIRDLTERRRHEQQIAHMAHHDALTDLPNRVAFNECIAATLDIAKARATASRCSASISTASRRSTTCSVMPSAMRCCAKSPRRMEAACAGRLPRPRRRRRVPRHHADRPAAGDRRGARRADLRGARRRYRHRRHPDAPG